MEINENINNFNEGNVLRNLNNIESVLSFVPKEIIAHIWSFLPMDKHWAQFPLVCKKWKQIFDSLPFVKLKNGDVNAKTPSFSSFATDESHLKRLNLFKDPFWMDKCLKECEPNTVAERYFLKNMWFSPFRTNVQVKSSKIAEILKRLGKENGKVYLPYNYYKPDYFLSHLDPFECLRLKVYEGKTWLDLLQLIDCEEFI